MSLTVAPASGDQRRPDMAAVDRLQGSGVIDALMAGPPRLRAPRRRPGGLCDRLQGGDAASPSTVTPPA